jgi:hypothetical protein
MRKLWATVMLHTMCKWFGHTKPLYRPLYRPWEWKHADHADHGVEMPYWLRPRVDAAVYSGQCERCWRVIDEKKYVELKARSIL